MRDWAAGLDAGTALQDGAMLGRIALAAVLAALIGWDRESRKRAAGLRTHILVGASASLMIMLGGPLYDYFAPRVDAAAMAFDPSRLLDALITGVSFLGAGTIFVSGRDRVRGLTTAASILATAGVGVAVGLHRYVLAAGTTVIVLTVLGLMRRVDGYLRDE